MSERRCHACDADVPVGGRFCAYCGAKQDEGSVSMSDGLVPEEEEDPFIGRTLGGGILIEEVIGVGAMGRVYKAEHISLKRSVAVKILHAHLRGDTSLEKRFQREARVAGKLRHPHCISIIDFGRADDASMYIAMEYVEGPNLGEVLADGPMPWERAVRILVQVTAALDEAHSHGVIHRDLKPENIVLEPHRTDDDFVRVLDFGIAKLLESENPEGVVTQVGAVCGTPEFMSPEQARGELDLDARADLYSVGCVLYQMLTGSPAFVGDSVMGVLAQQLSHSPPSPRTVRPDLDIPAEIDALCMRALEKDRSCRPSSAAAFQAELAAMIDGHARPVGTEDGEEAVPLMAPYADQAVTLSDSEDSGASEGSGVFGAAGAITEPAAFDPDTNEHVVASRDEVSDPPPQPERSPDAAAASSGTVPTMDSAPTAPAAGIFGEETPLDRSVTAERRPPDEGGKTNPSMALASPMAGNEDTFGQRSTDVFVPEEEPRGGALWLALLAALAAVGVAVWVGWR